MQRYPEPHPQSTRCLHKNQQWVRQEEWQLGEASHETSTCSLQSITEHQKTPLYAPFFPLEIALSAAILLWPKTVAEHLSASLSATEDRKLSGFLSAVTQFCLEWRSKSFSSLKKPNKTDSRWRRSETQLFDHFDSLCASC